MNTRTDLAVEWCEFAGEKLPKGVVSEVKREGNIEITTVSVTDQEGERFLQKPRGRYITVALPAFSGSVTDCDEEAKVVAEQLAALLPERVGKGEGVCLVCGLGNWEVTPDALGPRVVSAVLATRHLSGEMKKAAGLEELHPVAAVTPGVLGQTGVETSEILAGISERISPDCLLVIDALAARSLSRLGTTIQLSDTGICPGSGVANARREISRKTLGVPVISIGIPTVVDALTLALDVMEGAGIKEEENNPLLNTARRMMVTPKEIDLLIKRAAKVVSTAINKALQPEVSEEEIEYLLS